MGSASATPLPTAFHRAKKEEGNHGFQAESLDFLGFTFRFDEGVQRIWRKPPVALYSTVHLRFVSFFDCSMGKINFAVRERPTPPIRSGRWIPVVGRESSLRWIFRDQA